MTKAQLIAKTDPAAAETNWPQMFAELQADHVLLRTAFNVLVAKLNADAGVTDTNYAGVVTTGMPAGLLTDRAT